MVKRTDVPDEFRNTGPLATEKQVEYLNALRDGKDLSPLTPEQLAWLQDADFSTLPKHRASDVIEKLVGLDWQKRSSGGEKDMPDVADGRYAVPKGDGTLMFYSVKQGKYVKFVDVWASDARWPIKNRDERKRILQAIWDDPDAGPRFGREIGRCYVCGRTLTDELSRSLGIGPVCRGDQ
jgi:hypothetical protein